MPTPNRSSRSTRSNRSSARSNISNRSARSNRSNATLPSGSNSNSNLVNTLYFSNDPIINAIKNAKYDVFVNLVKDASVEKLNTAVQIQSNTGYQYKMLYIDYATYLGREKMVKLLLKSYKKEGSSRAYTSPLLIAVQMKRKGLVRILANHPSVNINCISMGDLGIKITALRASIYGPSDIMKYLLRKGANPNFKNGDGIPILIYLLYSQWIGEIEYGDFEKINILLQAGARVDAQMPNSEKAVRMTGLKPKQTALHAALLYYKDLHTTCDIVSLLVSAGADINKKDIDGRTPLMNVLVHKPFINAGIIELMIKKGAKLDIRDRNGYTALDIYKNTVNSANESIKVIDLITPFRKIKDLHLSNNLNMQDPVTYNTVRMNNAYILKTDLQNKNVTVNGQRKKKRVVHTVYNGNTIKDLFKKTEIPRGPITRIPFSETDVLKLSEVLPAKEKKRWLASRRPSNN